MHKGFLKTAAIIGLMSVALGAFAAHALKESVSSDALSIFETAVRYQFYHAFALLATGILYKELPNKFIKWSGILFIAGIILFSGSLYNWIGAITPLGGLAFILGWLFLFLGCLKK